MLQTSGVKPLGPIPKNGLSAIAFRATFHLSVLLVDPSDIEETLKKYASKATLPITSKMQREIDEIFEILVQKYKEFQTSN